MKKILTAVVMLVLLTGCATAADNGKQQKIDSADKQTTHTTQTTSDTVVTKPQVKSKTYTAAPAMSLDVTKQYAAVIKTNLGDFRIKLLADETPKTVNNFVFLAREKYFEGIKFHRVMKDFMIQTGDPKGDGTGGPGYKFGDELPSKHQYAIGIVAMANAGPNTNGSQFFIGTGPNIKNLNQSPNYTVFGEVESGMDIVQKIASVKVGQSSRGEVSVPLESVYIISVDIEEK